MVTRRDILRILLADNVTVGANSAPAAQDIGADRFSELVATWKIVSAERDSANETYDLYLITGDGQTEWDVVHFPQVAATGAKAFVARVTSLLLPQNVTTAGPGVAAVDSATLATATGQANVAKTLAAGSVRHGPWGKYFRYEVVVAGTIATGIVFTLELSLRQ